MGVIEALRHFNIPIEAYLEMDDRLSPSQKISLFLVFRAIRKASKEERRKRLCHGIERPER